MDTKSKTITHKESVSSKVGSHASKSNGSEAPPSFLFVLNPIDFFTDVPAKIAEGVTIRRANEVEIKAIKSFTKFFEHPFLHPAKIYEYDYEVIKKDNGSTSFKPTPLPPENWRYTVVSFHNPGYKSQNRSHLIGLCCGLAQPRLDTGFGYFACEMGNRKWAHAPSWNSKQLFSYWDSNNVFRFQVGHITDDSIKTLNECIEAAELKSDTSLIIQALNDYGRIGMLPEYTDAANLAYFSCLEKLLTHKPEPKDTIDSIRRQLRTKLKLLRKRFARTIEFENYIDSSTLTTDSKIWNKLYDYRSTIAHGGTVDFAKEFKALRGVENITQLLKETLRLTIIEGLLNEEFLLDLKDC